MESVDDARVEIILRAALALGRRLRSERPERAVTLSALSLLGALVRSGPMLASELAAAERLQPQSLTQVIARLEEDGLIARRRSQIDGRALVIAVTKAGRDALAEDLRGRRKWLERAMTAVLSPEERDILARAADVMTKLAFSTNDPV